ncbi:MAG TPA: EAL domain-containing protein [Pseudomonadales bacterium]
MSAAKNNYNVLIQVQNQNESERLISLFRGAGYAVRAHRITSEPDFRESIDDGNWDLLVADNRHPEVSLQFSLDTLKNMQADVPLVLITDDVSDETREQAFKLGVQDVIDKNNGNHFVHVAIREMDNARQRNLCRKLESDYQELKKRADMLMAESDDAIAYVTDGILMKVNDNFARMFGYVADELDCASIIDLVSEADQDKFKNFFRHFAKQGQQQAELTFKALKKDKQEFETFMTLAAATIDGDPCTQVNIGVASQGASATGGSGIIDAATGLHNRYYLAEQVTSTVMQIGKGIPAASLLVYRLDNAERLLDDVHFSGIDSLIADLATLLQDKLGQDAAIGRFGTDALGVILQQSSDKALELAKDSLKVIEDHICELDDRTVQYTCTCAVLQLNNKDARLVLDNAMDGIGHIRMDKEKNSAGIYVPPVKLAPKPGADDVASIDEAMEQNCFRLLYQPIMSLQGDDRENYEVTLWFNDGDNDVYPAEMIRAAGHSKLDRWMVLEATKTLSVHRTQGHNTRLIINLTMNALLDESLPGWLAVAAKAANLSTDTLVFQFDEEDVKNHLKAAITCITALRKAKFFVSIGGFGRDDEPFKLLKHLKLDLVKLDKQFSAMVSSGDSKAAKAIIDEAKEHEIATIMTDVDNAGALATLWQLGTHYIQGSYLQVPSPVMNYEFAEIA